MGIKFGIVFLLGILNGVVAKSIIFENQDQQTTEELSGNTECSTENQQTSHDTKCNLYYRCIYGRKICKECPDGMMFNPRIANCDSSYNVDCGSLETEEDHDKYNSDFSDYYNIDDFTNSDILDSYEVTTRKYTECPEKQDPYEPSPLLPHEERCNVYYKCVEGKKYLMKCPGMFQFNAKVLACDWPRNVKCLDRFSTTTEATTTVTDNSKEPTTKEPKSSEQYSQKTDYLEEISNKETTSKTDDLNKPIIYKDESSEQFAIKYFNSL
ncbi:unnamed protein product [Psylliodes chrysocephalus]|uniref:Chitin-binding type-2 domain-containing protein n=1 Tax=Psylliodes chrysocephalus TaxID=3402493 RepID=A0A9P0DBI2_9CUCU|nr:unnamed protein product [Psylliodes chrysocephala]